MAGFPTPAILRPDSPAAQALFVYGRGLASDLATGTRNADLAPDPGVQLLVPPDKAQAIAVSIVNTILILARLEWLAGRSTVLRYSPNADEAEHADRLHAAVRQYVPAVLNNGDDPARCLSNFEETRAHGPRPPLRDTSSSTGWCVAESRLSLSSRGRYGCRLTPACSRTPEGEIVEVRGPPEEASQRAAHAASEAARLMREKASRDQAAREASLRRGQASPKAPAPPTYVPPAAPARAPWWALPAMVLTFGGAGYVGWRLTRARVRG